MLEWGKRVLGGPQAPWWLALLAGLLAAPSLGLGLQTDDYLVVEQLQGNAAQGDAFQLSARDFEAGRRIGRFAWWSAEDARLRFLRPLAVRSHQLDLHWFGDNPLPMHLVNVVLYALLVAAAVCVLRRLLPAPMAGLAGLLFALGDGHAQALAWISSRNALLAALLAMLSLLAEVRARQDRRVAWRALSAVALGLSLASGEPGVVGALHLLAYAAFVERDSLPQLLRRLWPQGLVFALWARHYASRGYGSHGLTWYRDVFGQPLRTLAQGLIDVPIWLFSQLGLSMVGGFSTAPTAAASVLCALLVAPLVATLWPTLREDRMARFGALLMALAILPLLATVPQDRTLIGASLGSSVWIASTLQASSASRLRRAGIRALRALHLWLAPLLFILGLGSMRPMEGGVRELAAALPERDGARVVLLNAPIELLNTYVPAMRRRAGRPAPRFLHTLYAGASSLRVQRSSAHALEVEAEKGWGRTRAERVFAAREALPRVGQERRLDGMVVRVLTATDDGRPQRVRFTFPEPLEQDLTWLVWEGQTAVPWQPPAVGEVAERPALSFLGSLPRR